MEPRLFLQISCLSIQRPAKTFFCCYLLTNFGNTLSSTDIMLTQENSGRTGSRDPAAMGSNFRMHAAQTVALASHDSAGEKQEVGF